MNNFLNIQTLRLIAFASVLSLFSLACNDTGSPPNVVDTVISGVAQAGRISGGTVSAYKVVDGVKSDLLESVMTESDGSFTLNLAKYRGVLIIEISGGTFVDEATGQTLTLTTPMRTVLPSSMVKGDFSASITPFTTIAAQLALEAPGGLTEDNVVAAIANVNQWLGGEIDVSTMRPSDLSVVASITGSTSAERDYALIVAGMSRLAQDLGLDPNEIMQSVIDDASDGILDGMNGATPIFTDSTTLTALLADATTAFAFSPQNTFNITPSATVTDSMTNSNGAVAPVDINDTTAPVTTILSPLAGDTVGLTTTISWSTVDQSPTTVELEVSSDAGSSYTTLAAGLPKSGSYTWDTTVHSDGALYRIRITPTDSAVNIGTPTKSNGNFAVDNTAPVVTLTSPTGGERLTGTETITWTTVEANPGTVSIYLSDDSGENYPTLIADTIPDTGSYQWDTSSFPDASTYRVWVIHTDAAGHYNESLGIAENPTAPSHSLNDFTIDNTPTVFDFNGDGFDDIVIASNNDAYIFFGSETPPSTANIADADVTFEINADHSTFHFHAVSPAGDFNNDGYDDVLVADTGNYAQNGTETGRVYVYYGSATPSSTLTSLDADLTITGEPSLENGLFGEALSPAGDFNGDGFDDIVIGARRENDTGRAYVFFGSENPTTTIDAENADIMLLGENATDLFGTSVSSCDFNNDGLSDVVVGAGSYDGTAERTGRIYVLFGTATPSAIYLSTELDMIIDGLVEGEQFGMSVTSAGDFNGDGIDDIAACAPLGGVDDGPGRVFVFMGSSNPQANQTTTDAAVEIVGEVALFGWPVSFAGDLNQDGYDDLLAGHYTQSTLNKAYVIFGTPNTGAVINATDSGVHIVGDETGAFGAAVQTAGDFNDDGLPDFITCAPLDDEGAVDAGAIFLILGRAVWDSVIQDEDADLKIIGEPDDNLTCFRD